MQAARCFASLPIVRTCLSQSIRGGTRPCEASLIRRCADRRHLTTQLTARLPEQVSKAQHVAANMGDQQYQVLQPVKVTKNGVSTYNGDSILTHCFPTAEITEKDADGIVLGFKATEGPTAMQDLSLGKVCSSQQVEKIFHVGIGINDTDACCLAAVTLQQFRQLSKKQAVVDDTSLGLTSQGHPSRCVVCLWVYCSTMSHWQSLA